MAGLLQQLRDRLRVLALMDPGDPSAEAVRAALGADPHVSATVFERPADALEALTALGPEWVPVLLVGAAGAGDAGQRVQRLLTARPDASVALLAPEGDRRTLGEWFHHQPVAAHRVELLSASPHTLADQVRAFAEAALQRAAYKRALQRTSERMADLKPRTLELTAEPVQRNIVESLPSGLIVLNPEGYVVQINAKARELLKVPSQAGGDLELAPAEHIRDLIPQWVADDAHGPAEWTLTLSEDGGRSQYLNITSGPLGGEARPLGTVINVQDVTEQEAARALLTSTAAALESRVLRESRELAQVRQERDAIKRFIATLTHDLRSPLAAAGMSAQLLRHRLAHVHDDPDARNFDRIERNLRRIDRMIEDLLDLIRHDVSGELRIERQPCRLDELLMEAIEDLQAVHERPFHLCQPVPAVSGSWDPDGLRRIIENLGNNAVKYGDPDRPIEVRLQNRKEQAVLSVHNDGPPIPLERQRTLFEPFYRADNAATDAVPGWGIGLAFVRAMTACHDGTVSVSSDVEHGTVFTVHLPKAAARESGRKDGRL